ncbi:spore protein [Bacillus subtilis]|nr:spore protein [Bacillus subtilis]MDM5303163.1 spore protein [Bacillus subtilis]MDM5325216.1 spore protein [Bacillus subtilis]
MSENRHENEENRRDAAVANVQNSGNAKVVVNVNTDQDQAQAQSQDGDE